MFRESKLRLGSTLQLSDVARAFLADVSKLVSGSSFSQILAFLSLPILTRLYSPSDFGILAVYMGVIGIAAVVSCLRLETAIPLPRSHNAAVTLVSLNFGLLLIMVTISALVVTAIILSDFGATSYLNEIGFFEYLWLIPIGILLVGAYTISTYWAIRERNFGGIAVTRVFQGVVGLVVKVVGGLLAAGPTALIFGSVLAQSTGAWNLSRSLFRGANAPRLRPILHYRALLRRFKRFPLYAAPQSLLQTVGQQLPMLVLGPYFGIEIAGFFLLARQILFNPAALIGDSIRQVLYPAAVQAEREGRLEHVFWRSTGLLAVLGFAPALFVFLFGPDLFAWVFGDEWLNAGVFARYIVPWALLWLVSRPVAVVVPVTSLQRMHFVFEILAFLLRIAAIGVGVLLWTAQETILAISLIGIFFYLALIAAVGVRLRQRASRI